MRSKGAKDHANDPLVQIVLDWLQTTMDYEPVESASEGSLVWRVQMSHIQIIVGIYGVGNSNLLTLQGTLLDHDVRHDLGILNWICQKNVIGLVGGIQRIGVDPNGAVIFLATIYLASLQKNYLKSILNGFPAMAETLQRELLFLPRAA